MTLSLASRARSLGSVEQAGGRDCLTLGLKITNRSAKPLKYISWSRQELKVILRDRYGNFYKRIPPDSQDEVEIKPGETITDRLIFEPTAFGSEVTLDLPIPDAGQTFQFLIPSAFIERAPAPTTASNTNNQAGRLTPARD